MTADRHLAAARTTTAMTTAAARGDMATALRAWSTSPAAERALVLAQLAELPGLILDTVGASDDLLQGIAYDLAMKETDNDR